MTIIEVNENTRLLLVRSGFSSNILDNCNNSRFLAIEEIDKKIIGVCFVGGILNSNGIEILEEFRGKGLAKKLLNEVLEECKKRHISFMVGVFKPTNVVSIKTHIKIGYVPVFAFYYNKIEGQEIVVILPLNKKGVFLMKLLGFFNTRMGNLIFAILLKMLNPLLKNLIAFSGSKMPKIEFFYAVRNFNKVQKVMSDINLN
ncbi:hypothetical protein NSIN_10202 [Nitrosotalea sinensis]|uniref:N-acetyltransferase domain-containing protein n=1 Tax=Nitrosotalea sinensis TaxID=1499975 RepID=A0A2H1EF89_9ARCH|nr:GNAT family N-acetyltransferase [Candidatus Nitrosotalea sinensis]SHO42853.1 hypothetical protein NSIN_10202 [Candidatus Nitrosotalea sinensis]